MTTSLVTVPANGAMAGVESARTRLIAASFSAWSVDASARISCASAYDAIGMGEVCVVYLSCRQNGVALSGPSRFMFCARTLGSGTPFTVRPWYGGATEMLLVVTVRLTMRFSRV